MRVKFAKPLPEGFSPELEYGKTVFFRNDYLAWLRQHPAGSRYYSEHDAYSYKTGRKVWGRRESDGRRCLTDEVRHVEAGGSFHNVPGLQALVKMRAKAEGVAALMRADGTVYWAAIVGGKLVTRTGVAS